MNKYLQPEFLFCEIAIKDNTFNDNRIWVYHIKSLSLIEFIYVNDFKDFQFKGFQDRYEYKNIDGFIENWFAVYVQNNCKQTNQNSKKILKSAWQYVSTYFDWEDKNL